MMDQKPDHRTRPSMAPKLEPIETTWSVSQPAIENSLRSSENNRPSQLGLQKLHLKNPLFLRDDAIRHVLDVDTLPSEGHIKLASCIHNVGGSLLAAVEDLALVPLRDIPIRVVPIHARSMPNLDSLLSADAIELQLGDWSSHRVKSESKASLRSLRVEWPLDTPDLICFAKKLELLRRLSNDRVPVGVAVPVGDPSETGIEGLRWLSEMEIDFVTIRSAAACLGSRHPASSYFQWDPIDLTQRASSVFHCHRKKSLAIAIDHPWSDGFQAGQAILSGASLIGVGSFLANLIPLDMHLATSRSSDALASGLLGRSLTPSTTSLTYFLQKVDLHSALSTFLEQLHSSLEYAL